MYEFFARTTPAKTAIAFTLGSAILIDYLVTQRSPAELLVGLSCMGYTVFSAGYMLVNHLNVHANPQPLEHHENPPVSLTRGARAA